MDRNQTVMQHNFQVVPGNEIKRSAFNLSHGYKTTFDGGLLIPFFLCRAMPGDVFKLKHQINVRFVNALKFPIMDNIHIDTFYFACRYQLLWENFHYFMGEKDNPADVNTHTAFPVVTTPSTPGYQEGTLADYFGIPIGFPGLENVNALPFRMYNQIYKYFFKDQDLIDDPQINTDDGPDSPLDYELLYRCKKHDYFTACRPFAQKSEESVAIGLGGTAPVWGTGKALIQYTTNGTNYEYFGASSSTVFNEAADGIDVGTVVSDDPPEITGRVIGVIPSDNQAGYLSSGLQVDLSEVTSISIPDLREAIAVQQILERENLYGTRYPEIVQSAFGVRPPDGRMMRPEYLGGDHSYMHVQHVPQTSNDGSHGYVADLKAYCYGSQSAGFSKAFLEHNWVMGLICVRADLTYQEGLDQQWSESTKYDLVWPEFHGLGDQPVYRKELCAIGTANDDLVFGYQERYAQFKFMNSKVTGKLHSQASGTLHFYHLSQYFGGTPPILNNEFILENPPFDRIVTSITEPHFIMDAYFDFTGIRELPLYNVPGLRRL